MLVGCDWRAIIALGGPRALRTAATTATNYLRDPANPLNAPDLENERLSMRYRVATVGSRAPGPGIRKGRSRRTPRGDRLLRGGPRLDGEVDARERQARDEPIPEEIARLLSALVAEAIAPGEVLDIYDAAGLPASLSTNLGPDSSHARRQRRTRTSPSRRCAPVSWMRSALATRGNLVPPARLLERIAEIMNTVHEPATDRRRGDRRTGQLAKGRGRRGCAAERPSRRR